MIRAVLLIKSLAGDSVLEFVKNLMVTYESARAKNT